MAGGYNTYNKKPLRMNEMLDLPPFVGTIRERLHLKKKGQDLPFGIKTRADFYANLKKEGGYVDKIAAQGSGSN